MTCWRSSSHVYWSLQHHRTVQASQNDLINHRDQTIVVSSSAQPCQSSIQYIGLLYSLFIRFLSHISRSTRCRKTERSFFTFSIILNDALEGGLYGHSPTGLWKSREGNLEVVKEKPREMMCPCMWSITASIVLDIKYARKEFITK